MCSKLLVPETGDGHLTNNRYVKVCIAKCSTYYFIIKGSPGVFQAETR